MLFLLLAAVGQTAPEEEQTLPEAKIELTISVDPEELPQNETTTLMINLKWLGSQEAFEIEPLPPPSLDNLRIISSSSSVETKLEVGREVTLRRYRFVLKGQSEGVATIGRVQLNYQNIQTGKSSFLETQPIQLKITPAVSQSEFRFGLPLLIIAIAVAAGIIALLTYRFIIAKRNALPLSTLEAPPSTLEQRLLGQLSEVEIDLGKLTSQEFYDRVRSITLDYLRERYEVTDRSSTTTDIVAKLEQRELPEDISLGLKKVLLTYDQIRFGFKESSDQEKKEILSLLREVLEPKG